MNKEVIDKIESALFHIHAFAKLLETEASEHPSAPSAHNAWSSERLSLSQIIVEKAEFCLKAIDEMEVPA